MIQKAAEDAVTIGALLGGVQHVRMPYAVELPGRHDRRARVQHAQLQEAPVQRDVLIRTDQAQAGLPWLRTHELVNDGLQVELIDPAEPFWMVGSCLVTVTLVCPFFRRTRPSRSAESAHTGNVGRLTVFCYEPSAIRSSPECSCPALTAPR